MNFTDDIEAYERLNPVTCAACHTAFESLRDLDDHRLDDESECFMVAAPLGGSL